MAVGVLDAVVVEVGVTVAVGVSVRVGVEVGVGVGVSVAVRVAEAVDVCVGVGVGVSVRVGAGVGVGGVEPNSTAPLSQVATVSPSPSTGRGAPRWSSVSELPVSSTQPVELPVSITGLAGKGMCVNVKPPLSCSGPSSGSIGLPLAPRWSPVVVVNEQPVSSPIKL